MDAREAYRHGRMFAAQGVSFALIAALAFGAGLYIGERESTSAVIARIPLIGDGLDPTPDARVDLTNFWKAWNTLDTNYVVTHPSSTLPTADERLLGAIGGLVASYGDPYTVFFPPAEAKAFAESISGSFAGVGMEIGIRESALIVIAPLRGTPAEAAGIKAGDHITAIDGEPTDALSVEEAVRRIRGPAGTSVTLTIVRENKPIEIDIIRETIQVPETEDEFDEASGVYRIALFEFTANSTELFDQAFARFKASDVKRLVLDLRGNPGGYLDAAVDVASHFLPKGSVVVTEDFGGKEEDRVHTSLGYNDVPGGTGIVVLIDGGSASASEIVAGALQDADVATVIGLTSFGKGSVQTLVDLDTSSLKITVARWVTPSGRWIADNGIEPDISVPYAKAEKDEEHDSQMKRAIQFLTIGK